MHGIKWSAEKFDLDPSVPTLIEVPASASSGFFFPYYLYVPPGLARRTPARLLVEPNNTGYATDDFEVHKQSAKRLASQGYTRRLADVLQTPLLVPVFPRPDGKTELYTHLLGRKTLLARDAPLSRIDLQLLGMIQHARDLLATHGITTKAGVLIDGFSASGCFANRFAALHPEAVRALAAGGINGLPMFPLEAYQEVRLPFPIGVGDLQSFTGSPFNADAYRQVSQYLYMGYLDRNDTFPFSDAWDDDERALIAKLFGREMMPDRWNRSQEIVSTLHFPIQTVTYNGVAHRILPEMWDDVIAFFKANEGDAPGRIVPHEYPFVPFREIHEAHVKGIYWKGDPTVPEGAALFSGQRTFVVAIEDWIKGEDSQQLSAFVEKAGFDFDLVANGHAGIHIGRETFCGITSYNDGEFQGFYVCLDAAAVNQVSAGVPYSLRPRKISDVYFWTIPPHVVLLRRDTRQR
jgi:pimeloyl-ACP methyl ester carboxylesterase